MAEGVTGPDLPERVELVRAALADADRGRFEQELDQALDAARSTRDLRPLGHCCAAPSLGMGAAVPLVMRAGRPGGVAVGVVVIGSGCGGAHGLDGGRGHRVWVVGCG
jgi:Family of unknown function (DUF6247)